MIYLFLFISFFNSKDWTPQNTLSTADIRVHDPVMAYCDGAYYLYATGRGIAVWKSTDLKEWQQLEAVFKTPPVWASQAVPTFRGHIWAPDIHYHEGLYYLYYSVSAFGKNTSCIGVATNVTLNPEDPRYQWVDKGKVIQSYPNVTAWNAIDPHIIEDENGRPFMSFGSFWEGLQLVPLTTDRTQIDTKDSIKLHTLASRIDYSDRSKAEPSSLAGPNAIEAPFIFRKDGYFYLFASIDYCCRGKESTYKMILGRSKNLKGPYLDKNGKDLAKGGGHILLEGDQRWHGVGHNSVYHFNGDDLLVFHGYDGEDNGVAKLRIEKLDWNGDGWPKVRVNK
jgi:arabinan endo-1,5-alpha-L-arabinosidase